MSANPSFVPTVAIPPPAALPAKGNLSDNWTKWRQNFTIYLAALGLVDDAQTCPLFLHIIGQFGRDIYNKLELEGTDSLQTLYDNFERYCKPKSNLTCSRVLFFNTKQGKNQKFEDFVSGLKQMSKSCEFGELADSLLMTQIISGLANTTLRERLLTIPDLTYEDTLKECRINELAELHIREMAAASKPASRPEPRKPFPDNRNKNPDNRNRNPDHKNRADDHKDKGSGAIKRDNKVNNNQVSSDKKASKNVKDDFILINNPLGDQKSFSCKFCNSNHAYGKCPNFNKNFTKKDNN